MFTHFIATRKILLILSSNCLLRSSRYFGVNLSYLAVLVTRRTYVCVCNHSLVLTTWVQQLN